MSEPIFILGAGAIGTALAVHLTRAGRTVTALRTSADDIPGQTVEITLADSEGRKTTAAIEMVSLAQVARLDGIAVVTAKSYANRAIAEQLAAFRFSGPVVILQNGVGVEAPFLGLEGARVYRCVLYSTGQPAGENRYLFAAVRPSPVGVVRGDATELAALLARLHTDAFPFVAQDDISQEVWKKASINCVFNSVCPLLDVDNGIFVRDERAAALARAIVAECASVMRGQGMRGDESEIMTQLFAISRRTDGQLISTLQDINAGRETEIAALNLEIARLAEGLTPPVSVPLTKGLGELVKLKAELRRGAA